MHVCRLLYSSTATFLLLLFTTPPPVDAATFALDSDAGDGALQHTPSTGVGLAFPNGTDARVGKGGGAPNRANVNAVYLFELPSLVAADLTSAELSFPYIDGENSFSLSDLDVWGLGYVTSSTLDAGWLYVGDNDPDPGVNITSRQKIQDDIITGATPDPNDVPVLITTDATGNTNLRLFLASLYIQGALPGDFVVIRLNDDRANPDPNFGGTGGYRVGFQEFATFTPSLALTSAGDVDWIGGAGFGFYDDPTNWSVGAVPDAGDTIRFNQAGARVGFDLGVSPTVGRLEVNGGDVSFLIPDDPAGNETMTVLNNAFIQGGDLIFENQSSFAAVNLTVGDTLFVNSGSSLLVQDGGTLQANQLVSGGIDGPSLGTVRINDSHLNVSGDTSIRVPINGNSTITLENGSTAMLGSVSIARGASFLGAASMNIVSGATVETGDIRIMDFGSHTDIVGSLTVDGADSTLTMIGDAELTVGGAGVLACAIVSNGGVFNTGTGPTLIQESGRVIIDGGSFNANGDVMFDGGSLSRTGGGFFNLDAGRNLTASNDAQLNFADVLTIGLDTEYEINSGADLDATVVTIGFGSNGTLLVDGLGSEFTSSTLPGFASTWGFDGATADVTFRSDAQGTLGDLRLARDTDAGTTGNLTIESGAQVTMGDLEIATAGGTTTSGTVTVDGKSVLSPVTSLTQSGASQLTVGHASEGTAEIYVASRGQFITGTGGITVNATGLIDVSNAGVFVANADVLIDGGTLRTISAGFFSQVAGKTLTATNDAQLEMAVLIRDGTTWKIESGSHLTNFGFSAFIGSGSDGTLIVDGIDGTPTTAEFGPLFIGSTSGLSAGSGELTIRRGGRVDAIPSGFGSSFRIAESSFAGTTGVVNIEEGGAFDVAGGISVATLGGATTTGTINIADGGVLTQTGASTVTLGHASTGAATINLRNGGTFTTSTGAVTINTTGVLNINGGPEPGDNSGVFTANGPMTVHGQVNVPIQDGVITDPGGVLNVNAGLTIDGGTVSMFKGAIDADTISLANGGSFDFTGGKLSVGQFDGNLVNQGGTLAPGSSAGGTTIVGDYTQQSGASLEIEIGGTLQVTEYDFVSVTGTALLGGDLALSLIDGFTPNAADTFTVLSAANLAGFFGNVASGGRLDLVGGGGSFEVTLDFGLDQMVLSNFLLGLTGDFDHDGDVDGRDFLIWQGGGSPNGINSGDLAIWQAQYGSGVSGFVNGQTVPEPGALPALVVAAALAICCRKMT